MVSAFVRYKDVQNDHSYPEPETKNDHESN